MTLWKIFSKSANYSQHNAKGESLTGMQNSTWHVVSSNFCKTYIYPYRAEGKKFKSQLGYTRGGQLQVIPFCSVGVYVSRFSTKGIHYFCIQRKIIFTYIGNNSLCMVEKKQ